MPHHDNLHMILPLPNMLLDRALWHGDSVCQCAWPVAYLEHGKCVCCHVWLVKLDAQCMLSNMASLVGLCSMSGAILLACQPASGCIPADAPMLQYPCLLKLRALWVWSSQSVTTLSSSSESIVEDQVSAGVNGSVVYDSAARNSNTHVTNYVVLAKLKLTWCSVSHGIRQRPTGILKCLFMTSMLLDWPRAPIHGKRKWHQAWQALCNMLCFPICSYMPSAGSRTCGPCPSENVSTCSLAFVVRRVCLASA